MMASRIRRDVSVRFLEGERRYQLLPLNSPHDSAIFLGGKEKQTLEEWSKMLGKETIDSFNTSETKGNSPSYGKNFQKLGRDLMTADELTIMEGDMCIVQVRGIRPFLSKKYDITRHPLYNQLSDFDKRNRFNVERYLSTKLKIKPTDKFEVCCVEMPDAAVEVFSGMPRSGGQ